MHIESLLRGAHAFISPPAALAGLSSAAAARRSGTDHSIADIVAHMVFWQNWFLERCEGVATPLVASAAMGWREVGADEWPSVLQRFEEGFSRALKLAADATATARAVEPPIEFEPLSRYTVGDALTHLALHNAHHTGQVITLRQQAGQWPPPAGSWTW